MVNTTVGSTIYAIGTSGLGYSSLSGGNILTLQTSMTGMASGDNLIFFYDDGNTLGNDPDNITSGTITLTDSVVAAPAGDGTFKSGTSTSGSLVAIKCLGGDTTWNITITALTTGTLYFEGSLDSTNGTDGNWMSLTGRQNGLASTPLLAAATSVGMFQGNISGLSYFRVRSVGTLTGTPTVRIVISAGAGLLYSTLNPPLLTKGTQGSTGLTVQNLRDAGRTAITGYAEAAGGAVSEALFNLQVSSGFGTVANTTSYNVAAGKTLRLTSITINFASNATSLNSTRVRVRVNPSGTALISSTIVWSGRLGLSTTAAVSGQMETISVPIPDGLEIPGGGGLAISHIEGAASGSIDCSFVGFIY